MVVPSPKQCNVIVISRYSPGPRVSVSGNIHVTAGKVPAQGAKYNEAIDDHQLSIAKKLENEKSATVIYNIVNLESTIINNNTKIIEFKLNEKQNLIKNIKNYLTSNI